MKEAQKLIEDTINMIDEYEAKIDSDNRQNRKLIGRFIIAGIILVATALLISISLFLSI